MGELEERALLSLTIKIDYTYDSSNFFNTQAKRDVMQAAANTIASTLNDNLLAIQPSGPDTWMANFPNPSSGQQTSLNNLSVPANTIVIFVGGRALPGESEAGEGSSGGFSAQGSQNWLNLVSARGQAGALLATPTDFGPWGGAISFDNSGSTNWYFGQDTSGLVANQTDFRTVAEHEIGHVLGVGTSPSWSTYVTGGVFVGPASEGAHGGQAVPLDPNGQHWADGTKSDGVDALMDPTVRNGQRRTFTTLDYAGLGDIGWAVQPPAPSAFRFDQPSYTVSETSGGLLITVFRSGGNGAVSVNYATSNGTAMAGLDYTAASGTLNFAPGETFQSFTIPILNDQVPDGNETLNLTLSSPSAGATLAFPSSAAVSIVAPGLHPLGDYDGVGFTQIGIFRPTTANWIITGNPSGRLATYGAGNLFDIPVPGDYDGIGRTEQAVFRPSTAQWIIFNPTNQTQRVFSFGAGNLFDIPVPGDYDGVGRTEFAVFRPSTAQWFIYNPITNTQRVASYGAGNLFDIPVPGDYDGIGRTELAVFRPSTAQWFILNPIAQSQRLVSFGAANLFDFPLQAPIASLKKLGRVGGNSLRALSTEPFATSAQQPGTSASAFTTSSVPSDQSSGLPTHLLTGDDISTNTLPRRKLPAQLGMKSAWLEALDALLGTG